jgi:hypothetical protein
MGDVLEMRRMRVDRQIVMACAECHGQLFVLVKGGEAVCDHCDLPMSNVRWNTTRNTPNESPPAA